MLVSPRTELTPLAAKGQISLDIQTHAPDAAGVLEARSAMVKNSPHSTRWLLQPALAWAAAIVLLSTFGHLGSEIGEGETAGFDQSCLLVAQALRASHAWLSPTMRDLSGLGSTVVLTLATVAACAYLTLTGARRTALLMGLSVASASVTMSLLKSGFGRARPPVEFAEFAATGLSFPSGHSSMSAVVFLTLAMLLARTHDRLAERAFILATGILLAILVGISRVALGVHWATDVLGGWAFGAAWTTAWWLVARHFDHGGPPGTPAAAADAYR